VIEKTSWHWKRHKLGNGTCNWPWRLFFLSFKFQINEEENQLWASIRWKSRNFQSETRTRDNSESSLYEKIFWIFFISGMSYKVPKVNSFDPDPCFFVAAWSHSMNFTFQLNLLFSIFYLLNLICKGQVEIAFFHFDLLNLICKCQVKLFQFFFIVYHL